LPVNTEHGGNRQLNQLLQAVVCQFGINSQADLPSNSEAKEEAPESSLGMVRLDKVVCEPGERSRPPLAPPAVKPIG
jgi:hypothetical protein